MYIIAIILIILCGIFISDYRGEKTKKVNNYEKVVREIQSFILDIENLKQGYFTNSSKIELINKYGYIYYESIHGYLKRMSSNDLDRFKDIYLNIDKLVDMWNEEYIQKELTLYDGLLDNIDGKSLDTQQRKAVIVDEDNNLILAGAGSGKTLIISAKVKYLVETKGVKPEEILLISFTRKAANEMNERIKNKLGINVQSSTFHKLGLDIITQHRGKRLDISEKLENIIDEYFKTNIYNQVENVEQLIRFFGYYANIPKDISLFDNLGDYYKYCKNVDFMTLKGKEEIVKFNKEHEDDSKQDKKTIRGEQVKSLEEVIIANYLYLNGVNYIYEDKYKYEVGDRYRKQYRPDFYLPDYDIYIEHFGVNKNNKAPWLSKIEEQKYIDGIEWKRNLHKENGTILVETYSYYNTEGVLLDKLRDKLKGYDVKFEQVEYEKIYTNIIATQEDKYFKEIRKLIKTFIGLFKSSGYGLDGFEELRKDAINIENKFLRERSLLFLEAVRPIYINYEEMLKKEDEIDFNDMINQSTDIVKNGLIEFKYKYIIIDEYQDISKSRFNLIKEIKSQTNAKLICVGDDWQSIYRFAGSDVGLFTNFEKHVGYYKLLKIEKTYRNSQELIDIAGKFVMENNKQLVKNLKSDKRNKQPIKMIEYLDDMVSAVDNSIDNIVKEYGVNSNITILGRNNFDIKVLSDENSKGKYDYKEINKNAAIKSNKYPDLQINYLTAHKSKGLEADNVIIINLENKISGFPNQMVDDPVLDLVLTESDGFDFSEERRLFYVALTRTKNTAYLLVPKDKSSIFCDELAKEFSISIECIDTTQVESPKCPKCMSGNLVKRRNAKGNSEFVGCTNYPMCDYTCNSVDTLDNVIICETCNGYMVKREYNSEYFLGCSNYPYCKNTMNYDNYDEEYNDLYDFSEELDEIYNRDIEADDVYYKAGREYEAAVLDHII